MDLLVAFFDLTNYFRQPRGQSNREISDLMSDYYEFLGDIVDGGGGTIVKFIGDAALTVFPENRVDDGVLTLRNIQNQGDKWMKDRGLNCRHIVKAHFGPVCTGPIGTRSDKRFDLFGETVGIAATLRSNGFAITSQVFRKLSPETRKQFKKHTPPISYIPVDERHRD